MDKKYDFLDAVCHNMDIGCYNFIKQQENFCHIKFLNEKIDLQKW